MEIISEQTNEEPLYFEFKKLHFMSTRPGNAGLRYDPFPDAQLDDVVRKEIIGRKLVWKAKIKGANFDIRPGIVVQRDGHKFAVTKSTVHIDTEVTDVTGDELQGECEPAKTLARLIAMYAVNNPEGI